MHTDILTGKEIIACSVCGDVHLVDSETYVTFYGNVTIGKNGGIIGDNFNAQNKLRRVTIICRKRKCFNHYFNKEFFNVDKVKKRKK